MAVTPANQTFRAGILPVLLQLDVNLDLPDQDVGNGDTEYDSFTAFNYNNPVYFVGMESIRSVPIPDADANIAVALIGNATNPFQTSLSVPAGTFVLSAIVLDTHGEKMIAGLPPTPAVSPRGPIKHLLLYSGIIAARGAVTSSGSNFTRARFVNDNSVVRITA